MQWKICCCFCFLETFWERNERTLGYKPCLQRDPFSFVAESVLLQRIEFGSGVVGGLHTETSWAMTNQKPMIIAVIVDVNSQSAAAEDRISGDLETDFRNRGAAMIPSRKIF